MKYNVTPFLFPFPPFLSVSIALPHVLALLHEVITLLNVEFTYRIDGKSKHVKKNLRFRNPDQLLGIN